MFSLNEQGDLIATTTPGYVFTDGSTQYNYGRPTDVSPTTPVEPILDRDRTWFTVTDVDCARGEALVEGFVVGGKTGEPDIRVDVNVDYYLDDDTQYEIHAAPPVAEAVSTEVVFRPYSPLTVWVVASQQGKANETVFFQRVSCPPAPSEPPVTKVCVIEAGPGYAKVQWGTLREFSFSRKYNVPTTCVTEAQARAWAKKVGALL